MHSEKMLVNPNHNFTIGWLSKSKHVISFNKVVRIIRYKNIVLISPLGSLPFENNFVKIHLPADRKNALLRCKEGKECRSVFVLVY